MRTSATMTRRSVEPEQGIELVAADCLTLNDRYDHPAGFRELQKADHGERDREDAEIFRRKEPAQDDGHCDVQAEMERLRYEDGGSPADGAALQIVDVCGRWGAIVRIPERGIRSSEAIASAGISIATRWRDRILIACGSDKSPGIGSLPSRPG